MTDLGLRFSFGFVYYFLMLFYRFCSECKSKVLHAYNILIGELDCVNEKGYQPSLYEGLRCCSSEQHIHISCDTQYIAQLITRAESDVLGR